MSYNRSLNFILVALVPILLSCFKAEQRQNIVPIFSEENVVVSVQDSEKTFKIWLKDTLVTLALWKDKAEANIVKKSLVVSPDSLLLTLESYYEATIYTGETSVEEIHNIVELLDEYNESPDTSFKLSFLFQRVYYPSSTRRIKYEHTYEVKNVVVIEGNKTTRFNFIRGRISGKEVTLTDQAGEENIIKTDFVWKGDTLIKIPQIKTIQK